MLKPLFGTLWSHFALKLFTKSVRTLRTCPELSTTVSDNFEFSVRTHFGPFSSSDNKI